MGLGRKFWLGLAGIVLIAIVQYVSSQFPIIAPFVGWVVTAIAGATGITVASIAHEDSQQAHAAASVEIAKVMAASPVQEATDAPANATTVNVGAQTPTPTGGTA